VNSECVRDISQASKIRPESYPAQGPRDAGPRLIITTLLLYYTYLGCRTIIASCYRLDGFVVSHVLVSHKTNSLCTHSVIMPLEYKTKEIKYWITHLSTLLSAVRSTVWVGVGSFSTCSCLASCIYGTTYRHKETSYRQVLGFS